MLDTLRTRDDNVLETDGRRWDMVVLGDAIDRSRGNVALAIMHASNGKVKVQR